MSTRIVVDLLSGETLEVALTQAELDAQAIQYAAWQVEEAARLAKVSEEEARQAKFEEWLATQGVN
jgi:hypothetical protein